MQALRGFVCALALFGAPPFVGSAAAGQARVEFRGAQMASLSPPAGLAAPSPAARGARPGWLETERLGPPYQLDGRWYVPAAEPGYEQHGGAAAVTPDRLADPRLLAAAHPTLPLPSLVQVTAHDTGRELILRVVDRAPVGANEIVALTPAALEALGLPGQGGSVHVRYLGPAPKPADMRRAAPAQRPATPAASAGDQTYAVQIGAFSSEGRAQAAAAKARAFGPVQVEEAGGFWRVRIAPLDAAAAAQRAREQAAQVGFGDARIVAMR